MTLVKDMIWSFSRLSSYYQCPYEWYKHYVENQHSEGGFFSSFGTLMHLGLEKILNGELSVWESPEWYEENFNKVITYNAPPNPYVDICEKYYNEGFEYFANLAELDDKYEILGIEKEVNFKIKRNDFIGYIDLLLRDKKSKEIIIVDHKTATLKFKKNGEISKTDAEHFENFKRQLYIYSKPVIAKYKHVDKLCWNMVRMNKLITIPFDRDEYEKSLEWATDTIKKIKSEVLWLPNQDTFYCQNLCGIRDTCDFNECRSTYKVPSDEDFYGGLDIYEGS